MADPRASSTDVLNTPEGVHSHSGEIRPHSGRASAQSLSRIGSGQSYDVIKTGPTAGSKGIFNPKMLQSKRDIEPDAMSVKSVDSTMSHKSVSFVRKKPAEIRKVIGYDGQEITLISVDCQTEWSWLDDAKVTRRMAATPHRYRSASTRGSLSMPGGAEAQDTIIGDDDTQSTSTVSTKHTNSTMADYTAQRVLSGGSTRTKKERVDTAPESTARASQAQSITLSAMQMPSREDEYGIPLMELSSDSEISDDDSTADSKPSQPKHPQQPIQPVDHKEVGTLPSVGPPQILQYNRESEQKPAEVDDPKVRLEERKQDSAGKSAAKDGGGSLEGPCEFCGQELKPFPTLDQQRTESPSQLYCCSQYRELIEMMLSKEHSEQEDGMIDINPHPPYGSKADRKAAKERAAQRFRERELARQQTSLSMGASQGGLSSAANQMNFYNQYGLEELSEEDEVDEKGGEKSDKGGDEKGGEKRKKGAKTREKMSREKSFGLGGGLGARTTTSYSSGPANYANYMQNEVTRQMKTINYQLSSQKCLDEGWTLRPPTPLGEIAAEVDVFEPQPLPGQLDDYDVIVNYYPSGNKFLIIFPDGTGNVFYPSGNVAISISSCEVGLYTYVLYEDAQEPDMLGVFDADGKGTSYYANGSIRLCLDPIGGLELDVCGNQKRKWNWKEQVEHIHAPPIQPIMFSVTNQIALKVLSQENVVLTFASVNRSCKFQIGSRLKYKAPDNRLPPMDFDDDKLMREETKARIQMLFNKVTTLLKFPNSPKLKQISTPLHLTQKMNKIENIKAERNARLKKVKPSKGVLPGIKVT